MTTFADLKTYVRDNYSDAVDAKSTRVYERIVDRALRRVGKVTDWSFLMDRGRINFVAPFETGTVALTQDSKAVTLTGGVWPTTMGTDFWHVNFDANTEGEFEGLTRTSGTVIQLDEVWPFATTASSQFTAYRREYALPTDFRKFLFGEMQETWGMDYISPAEFTDIRLAQNQSGGDPQWFTLFKQRSQFWPFPTEIRVADFLYVRWPKLLSDAGVVEGDTIDWDEHHLDLLFAALDLEVARSWGDGAPESMREAVTMYQGELREAKGADSERALTLMHYYSLADRYPRGSRWRSEATSIP